MNCSPREVFVSTFLLYVTEILTPQNVVHGPKVSSLPESLLKRQCWDPHRACCLQSHILTKSPGDSYDALKFKNYPTRLFALESSHGVWFFFSLQCLARSLRYILGQQVMLSCIQHISQYSVDVQYCSRWGKYQWTR